MPGSDDPRLEITRRLLGHRLRDARLETGLNLAEAADWIGVSTGHLSDCERGRRLPSLPTLLAMSDTYGVLVTDWLDGLYPLGARRRPRRLPPPPPDLRIER